MVSHCQLSRIHCDVTVDVARRVGRTIHANERPKAEVGVHSERVRPLANWRDREWNAHVKSDLGRGPSDTDSLVRQQRSGWQRSVTVTHGLWYNFRARGKGSQRARVRHPLDVGIRGIEYTACRVEVDTCGATINVPPVLDSSSDDSMLSSHTRQRSTGS